MANLVFEANGARGRSIRLYDTKCVIKTSVTVGSVLTGNATDGEKTIFLKDVVGVQFKRCGLTIGYLQFETASMQMNNKDSNTFSENTFTFEETKENNVNDTMQNVYNYVVARIEELKYEGCPASTIPAPEIVAPEPPKTIKIDKPADTSDSWICKKCGSRNSNFQKYCKDCGAYK